MDDNMFDELLNSVEEMNDIIQEKTKPSRVFEYKPVKVKAIRTKAGLTQEKFALAMGVSKRTLENWEQGRRSPTGAAKSLLKAFDLNPELATQLLA